MHTTPLVLNQQKRDKNKKVSLLIEAVNLIVKV